MTELQDKAAESVEILKKRNAKQIQSASQSFEQKQARLIPY